MRHLINKLNFSELSKYLFLLILFFIQSKSFGQADLIFSAGNKARMVIGQNGPITIGIHNYPFKTKLGVHTVASDSASIFSVNYNQTANVPFGNIYSEIRSSQGAAISGLSLRANTESSIEPGNSFGVLGNGGPGAIAVGAYSTGGTAVRAMLTSGVGYALRTSGPLKLDGISEGANKVLTSDVNGNATWQSLPAGVSVWAVSGNNIYNSNTGDVGIGHNNPSYGLDVRSPRGTIFHTNSGDAVAGNTVRILKNYAVPIIGPFTSDAALEVKAGGLGINGAYISSTESYGVLGETFSNGAGAGVYGYAEWATGVKAYTIHGTGIKGESANATGIEAISGAGNAIFAYSNLGSGIIARSNNGTTASIENLNAANANNLMVLTQFGQGDAIKIAASSGVGVNLENASLKVSGTKRTAFQVTGTGANSITISNITTLANAASDMLFVTHNGVTANILTPVYVKFVVGSWVIYTESGGVIPATEIFNVLVVKQ